MKKTKFSIDLGNLKLTDTQREALLEAIHKTVESKTKSLNDVPATAAAATRTTRVSINVVFRDVTPNNSLLLARVAGQEPKSITSSSDINFSNVKMPGSVLVRGKSLGSTEVTITVDDQTQTRTFVAGTFRFIFDFK